MPVHLMGKPADMDAIASVAKGRGIHLIEDAAEAVYAGTPIEEALATAKEKIDQALVDYKELMGG